MPTPIASATDATAAPAASARASHHLAFRALLSELNPLQYIPVIGTLYRAITGDSIPEATREAGSLIVSGLTAGPIGVALNVATVLVEKATGVDPERVGTQALASLGIGAPHRGNGDGAAPSNPPPPARPALTAPVSVSRQAAWSREQLAAYGITTSSQDTLEKGNEHGSDVLNALELARLQTRPIVA